MSLKVTCPKCHGKKTMNDPQYIGKMLAYCDRDGNRCPQVTCITCDGVGHVLSKGSPYTVDDESIKQAIREERKARKANKTKMPSLTQKTLEQLQAELIKALHDEDYERCAQLRDEIAKRKGQ